MIFALKTKPKFVSMLSSNSLCMFDVMCVMRVMVITSHTHAHTHTHMLIVPIKFQFLQTLQRTKTNKHCTIRTKKRANIRNINNTQRREMRECFAHTHTHTHCCTGIVLVAPSHQSVAILNAPQHNALQHMCNVDDDADDSNDADDDNDDVRPNRTRL